MEFINISESSHHKNISHPYQVGVMVECHTWASAPCVRLIIVKWKSFNSFQPSVEMSRQLLLNCDLKVTSVLSQ